MPAECSSCHAEIDWAVKHPLEIDPATGRPKTTPVDHDSADAPGGNLAVWYDEQHVLRFRYLRKDAPIQPGEHLGKTHFASCPQAAQHRRSK